MKRAALLSLPAFVLLAASAFAGEPASDQKPSPTPAKSEVAAKKAVKTARIAKATNTIAAAKSEKTSPALDRLFDSGKLAPADSASRHPDPFFSGGAEMSFFVSGR